MELDRRHYDVIKYLAQPNRGGLTLAQIAEEVGVSERTIYHWKKDPTFVKELKKTIIEYTHDELSSITKAMIDEVKKNGNAAMAKLILQMNDMLPTSGERVEDKLGTRVPENDVQSMQKRIAEFKARANNVVNMSQ